MKVVNRLVVLLLAIVVARPALAGLLHVDCTKGETVAKAVEQAKPGDTIQVTGTCKETVMITTDRVTLDGQGSAILDGGGVGKAGTVVSTQDWLPYYQGVLTIDGARGVVVTGFTVQHGVDGITCKNGATCIIQNTTLQDNADEGIQVSQNATADLINCTLQRNAECGLDDGASITISQYSDNGTDIDLSFGARATLKGNTIGTITCDKGSMIRGDVTCPE
jgi:nitrous oxidase accessory protein NosD